MEVACNQQREHKLSTTEPAAPTAVASKQDVSLENATTATASAAPRFAALSEKDKIEKMLTLLAASGVHSKWHGIQREGCRGAFAVEVSSAGSRVTTAQEFIDLLATKSSASVKAYQIRKKDGAVVASGDWFKELLAAIEAGK